VFPGQGTHAPGMGAPWVKQPAWSVLDRAEAALGEPLAHLVLDAGPDDLARTRAAQLAVLTTSLIAWEAVRPLLPDPVAFGGHSLGQVTALIAARTLSLDDGVRFAARRAELTQAAADVHPGRMAALLGATVEQAEAACDSTTSWVANVNADGQIVVAGTPDGVDAALERARALGVRRVRPLDVGGAFHTPLMDGAKPGLAAALADVALADPEAPVVSNADAVAYADGESWRTLLVDHPTQPVRWADCMRTLVALGAQAFVEVGHGSMIAGVAKRTVADIPVFGVADPGDLDTLAEVLR
jgi:[acyl-carrier-protein] S-malonyltransferase